MFTSRRVQIATLAARYMLPAIYYLREFVDAGGLMSYGPSPEHAASAGVLHVC
jgi:putative ABC transport system substrate-binding protein